MGEELAQECVCDILRRYEAYCYQMSFYLLGNEKEALKSAELALLRLGADSDFLKAGESARERRAKSVTMASALIVRKQAVLTVT